MYRTGTFNLDLERTELTGTATEVVVKQVQPQFIIAEMKQVQNALPYSAMTWWWVGSCLR